MTDLQDKKSPEEKAFEVAVDTRKFEIGLVWSRTLVFWGFIAPAFAAYALLRKYAPDISLVVACFGFVCSLAWTLVNRGSKYWQESWEIKVEQRELGVTGKLFGKREERQDKGIWLSGREFSVSKLAIALSDYTMILWGGVVIYELFRMLGDTKAHEEVKVIASFSFVAFTVIFSCLMFWKGRSSKEQRQGTPDNDTEAKSVDSAQFSEEEKALKTKLEKRDGWLSVILNNVRDIFICITLIASGVIVAIFYESLPGKDCYLGFWVGLIVSISGFALLITILFHSLHKLAHNLKGTSKYWLVFPFGCLYLTTVLFMAVATEMAQVKQLSKLFTEKNQSQVENARQPQSKN